MMASPSSSLSALAMVDHLQHVAINARDACTASTLKTAHAKIRSAIRQHAALALAAEQRAKVLRRGRDVCAARLELLAELKRLHIRIAGCGGDASRSPTAAGLAQSSFAALFGGEDRQNVISSEQTTSTSSTSNGNNNLFTEVHLAVCAALHRADALCTETLPALGHGVPAETVLLFEPVLGLSASGGQLRNQGQVDDERDDSSSSEGDEERSPTSTSRSLDGGDAFLFSPLQRQSEEAYLHDVILAQLSQEALVELLDNSEEAQQSQAVQQQGTVESSTSPSLHSLLAGAAERLALVAALEDVRSNEPKMCKRPTDAPLALRCPPAVLVGSPATLPYCVAVVYGAAALSSIRLKGLHATLVEVVRWAATAAAPTTEVPHAARLDLGVLQFLVQCVLESAARQNRLYAQDRRGPHCDEEMDAESMGVVSCMRELRRLLRRGNSAPS